MKIPYRFKLGRWRFSLWTAGIHIGWRRERNAMYPAGSFAIPGLIVTYMKVAK